MGVNFAYPSFDVTQAGLNGINQIIADTDFKAISDSYGMFSQDLSNVLKAQLGVQSTVLGVDSAPITYAADVAVDEVWEHYVGDNGARTAQGKAVEAVTKSALKFAFVAAANTADNKKEALAAVSIPVSQAAQSLVASAGYKQTDSSTFFQGLTEAMEPYLAELGDDKSLAVMVDSLGNTYYPFSLINDVKTYADSHKSIPGITPSEELKVGLFSITPDIPYCKISDLVQGKQYSMSGSRGDWFAIEEYTEDVYVIYAGAIIYMFSKAPFKYSKQIFNRFLDKEYHNITTIASEYDGRPIYVSGTQSRERAFESSDLSKTRAEAGQWHADETYNYCQDGGTLYSAIKDLGLTPTKTCRDGTVAATMWYAIYGDGTKPEAALVPWDGESYIPANAKQVDVLEGFDADGNPITRRYIQLATAEKQPGQTENVKFSASPGIGSSQLPSLYNNNGHMSLLWNDMVSESPASSALRDALYPPLSQEIVNSAADAAALAGDVAAAAALRQKAIATSPLVKTPTYHKASIQVPEDPVSPQSGSGLYHVYSPSYGAMQSFGAWLWSDNIIDIIKKQFNNPMDAIIGIHEIYTAPTLGASSNIKVGYSDSGIAAPLIGNRYSQLNCGTVIVKEKNCDYLDYAPYTEAALYLPFIGIVPLDIRDIMGRGVNVTYKIDSYTGACVAIISVCGSDAYRPLYTFPGNCASDIPWSSGSRSMIMNALIGAVGTAISAGVGIASGGAFAGAAFAAEAAGSAAKNAIGSQNAVRHSGAFGSTLGAMCCKTPYIIIKRPVEVVADNYALTYGFPAHKLVVVGGCTGFLRAIEVRCTSSTATNEEKEMIVNYLKNGVFVR